MTQFDTLRANMGEVFSLRVERGTEAGEELKLVEKEVHLNEIYKLLSRLVERTGDLPSAIKKNIRLQMQAHLSALGVDSLEDYEKLSEIYAQIDEKKRTLPSPSDYPEKEVFAKNLTALYRVKGKEEIPGVPDPLLATYVAAHGQADWSQIEGRGGKAALDYLYDLGKIMTNRLVYGVAFDANDAIQVGKDWKIENGRHRALTLRILGNHYVEQKGMDEWVIVEKEA